MEYEATHNISQLPSSALELPSNTILKKTSLKVRNNAIWQAAIRAYTKYFLPGSNADISWFMFRMRNAEELKIP